MMNRYVQCRAVGREMFLMDSWALHGVSRTQIIDVPKLSPSRLKSNVVNDSNLRPHSKSGFQKILL